MFYKLTYSPMNYVLPKDIALKFWTSLKTVYNYLSKYPDKVRIKKQFWKTYVFENDFEKLYSNDIQSVQNNSNKNELTQFEKGVWTLKDDFKKLQNEYTTLSDKNEGIIKYNLALQEQVGKYALLLNDEKNERKEIANKLEILQRQYSETLVVHWKEKLKAAKGFYLLLGVTLLLLLFVIMQLLPQLWNH